MSQDIKQYPSLRGTLYLHQFCGKESEGLMIQVGQESIKPVPDADRPGFIQLSKQEAAELGEKLLRWAYEETESNHRQRDWESLPSRIASHLWNVSDLRHGMFMPTKFSQLCETHIRSFFSQPPQP